MLDAGNLAYDLDDRAVRIELLKVDPWQKHDVAFPQRLARSAHKHLRRATIEIRLRTPCLIARPVPSMTSATASAAQSGNSFEEST